MTLSAELQSVIFNCDRSGKKTKGEAASLRSLSLAGFFCLAGTGDRGEAFKLPPVSDLRFYSFYN